jgi:hypothetical protein
LQFSTIILCSHRLVLQVTDTIWGILGIVCGHGSAEALDIWDASSFTSPRFITWSRPSISSFKSIDVKLQGLLSAFKQRHLAMAASAAATMSAFLPAPSGYIVNFDHPQRNGLPLAYWLTGVSFVCAVFALAMRIYTRTIIVKDFKLEDCKSSD